MQSEKRFDQAVQLAAAFIANGDIRIGDDLLKSQAHAKLSDLIAVLYETLQQARANVGSHLIPPNPEEEN